MASYKYSRCRAMGHSWDHIPNVRRPPWGKLFTFRCEHCGTVREDIMDSNFNLSSRRYTKPYDYPAENLPRNEWRKKYLRRSKA